MQQKRIALINDITGFGRCSIAVELPLISALKVQACPFPTAILSAHTGFSEYFFDDYTKSMHSYMANWQKLHLQFDGILTGFLGSEQQIDIVVDFIKKFKLAVPGKQPLLIVDPVMGDNGRLYASYTPKLCQEMKKLLTHADVLTPNLTEACNLIDIKYPAGGLISNDALYSICQNLAARRKDYDGQNMKIIITGISRGQNIGNYIYEDDLGKMIESARTGSEHSGTGDAFVAIVAASLVKNESIVAAVSKAAEFIRKSLLYTESLNIPWNEGLCFEEYLTTLK